MPYVLYCLKHQFPHNPCTSSSYFSGCINSGTILYYVRLLLWVYILHYFLADEMSSSLEGHPLQLDSSMANLHNLSAVHTDLKKGAKDSNSPACAAGSHGACLTLNDHDYIRQFIQEFTFRGLLPHIEKTIRQLNDQVRLISWPSTYCCLWLWCASGNVKLY